MIDTLAMAYAGIGDFDSAMRYEEKALVIKGVKPNDSKRLQDTLIHSNSTGPCRVVK